MPVLKRVQGNQVNLAYSNTVCLANSTHLLRIVSANSLPPFHYFILSLQSASCCADHIHFSHVHPALTALHAKSDNDLLNPYIFISKFCSHGSGDVLHIFTLRAMHMDSATETIEDFILKHQP